MRLWPPHGDLTYDQLTEEEKSHTWIIDGPGIYTGTTWKWTAASLQPLSGTSMKENTPSEQNFEQHT